MCKRPLPLSVVLAGVLLAGCGSSASPAGVTREDAAEDPAKPDGAATEARDGAGSPDAHVAPEVPPDAAIADAVSTDHDATMAVEAGTMADAQPGPTGAVVWAVDNLQAIGGHAVTVLGAPMVIDTPAGKAVQFDGKGDALLVDSHPVAGLAEFTAEIVFRPDAGGATAQRFFHMQENASDDRVLFEIRLMNGNFFLDVVLKSGGTSVLLYTAGKVHAAGAWYAVAVVVGGGRAHTYVDGVEQTMSAVNFKAPRPGRTSIGVRVTRDYFFKGAIRLARFTPRPLMPGELLAKDDRP
jgi:hypothetical protein